MRSLKKWIKYKAAAVCLIWLASAGAMQVRAAEQLCIPQAGQEAETGRLCMPEAGSEAGTENFCMLEAGSEAGTENFCMPEAVSGMGTERFCMPETETETVTEKFCILGAISEPSVAEQNLEPEAVPEQTETEQRYELEFERLPEESEAAGNGSTTIFCIQSGYRGGSLKLSVMFPLQSGGELHPRAGRDFVVSVTVAAENTEFAGRVNVLMQNTGENHIMFSENVPALNSGEDYRTRFVLPMQMVTEGLYFSLQDGDGLQTAELALKVEAVNYGDYRLIGILSEQAEIEQYEYFSSFGNSIVELDREVVSEGAAGLDSLDIIVTEEETLRAFYASGEAETARETLRDWVGQGKTLVVGARPESEDSEQILSLGLQDAEQVQELVLRISNYDAARNSILASNEELKKQNGSDARTCYIGDAMLWPALVSNLSDEPMLLPVKELSGVMAAAPETSGDLAPGAVIADSATEGGLEKEKLSGDMEAAAGASDSKEIGRGPEGTNAMLQADSATGEEADQMPAETVETEETSENLSFSADRWDWWSEETGPEVIWQEQGEAIILKYSCGAGTVLVFQIPLEREKDSIYPLFYYRIVQLVLDNISGYQRTQLDYERYGSTAFGKGYMLDYISNEIPGVSVFPYLLLLLFYIGAVIPVLFLLLRHRQRSKYLWGVLPLAAVLMTGAVYLVGSKTRVTEPYCAYIDIADYTVAGRGINTVYFSLSAPTNQGAQITIPADVEARLQGNGFLAYDSTWTGEVLRESNTERARDYRAAVYYGDSANVLSLENVAAFSNTSFYANRKAEESGGFAGSVSLDAGLAVGTIRNETGKEWKNVLLVADERLVNLGSLDSGAAVELAACGQRKLMDVDLDVLRTLIGGQLTRAETNIIYGLMWDYAYNETGGQGFLISISENSAAEEILGGVTRDSHSRGVSLAIFPLQEEGL